MKVVSVNGGRPIARLKPMKARERRAVGCCRKRAFWVLSPDGIFITWAATITMARVYASAAGYELHV